LRGNVALISSEKSNHPERKNKKEKGSWENYSL